MTIIPSTTNNVINNMFSADYCFYIHDNLNRSILKFYYYKKDSNGKEHIALQHFSSKKYIKSYPPILDLDFFKFTENTFINFVNKLAEFVAGNLTGGNVAYIGNRTDEAVLRVEKISRTDYIIARADDIYEAVEFNNSWYAQFSESQIKLLLEQLFIIKEKILEKYCKN